MAHQAESQKSNANVVEGQRYESTIGTMQHTGVQNTRNDREGGNTSEAHSLKLYSQGTSAVGLTREVRSQLLPFGSENLILCRYSMPSNQVRRL